MHRSAMDDRGDYSTLEVAPEQPGLMVVGDQPGLETVPHQHQHQEYYQQHAQGNDPSKYGTAQTQNTSSPPPIYSDTTKGYSDAVAAQGGGGLEAVANGGHLGKGAVVAAPAERRIWGMKRKTFFIVLAVALLVIIGAVVGGVVGGTVGKKSGSTAADASPTVVPVASNGTNVTTAANSFSMILSDSQLASLNWTDVNGTVYYGVFWQDKYTNLIMSLYSDDTSAWETVNISARLGASSVSIVPKAGTPLAPTVQSWPWTVKPYNLDFTLALFFVNATDVILMIETKNLRGGSWSLGDLTQQGISYEVSDGSGLSAHWDLCATNCTDNIYLYYVGVNQALRVANQSNWATSPTTIVSNIEAKSPLANAVMSVNAGYSAFGSQELSLRVYYDTSGIIQEYMRATPYSAWQSTQTIARQVGDSAPLMAATSFQNVSNPSLGAYSIVNTQVLGNGSLRANYWNNYTWHGNTAPVMQGAVFDNFTALGLNRAMRFFGITNDSEIQQFSLDRTNPLSWKYVGQVPGTNVTGS